MWGSEFYCSLTYMYDATKEKTDKNQISSI